MRRHKGGKNSYYSKDEKIKNSKRYDGTYYVDSFDDSIIGSDARTFYHGASMLKHKNVQSKIKRG